jgi:hypothetical protein
MTGSAKPVATEQPEMQADLETYGIIVSHTPVYEWNGYRYSNAHDAVAAAKRGR